MDNFLIKIFYLKKNATIFDHYLIKVERDKKTSVFRDDTF